MDARTDRMYYHNTRTNATQWVDPRPKVVLRVIPVFELQLRTSLHHAAVDHGNVAAGTRLTCRRCKPPVSLSMQAIALLHVYSLSGRMPLCGLLTTISSQRSINKLNDWRHEAKQFSMWENSHKPPNMLLKLRYKGVIPTMQVSRAAQVAAPSPQPAPVVQTRTVVGAFSLLLAGVVATRLWAHWTGKNPKSPGLQSATGLSLLILDFLNYYVYKFSKLKFIIITYLKNVLYCL